MSTTKKTISYKEVPYNTETIHELGSNLPTAFQVVWRGIDAGSMIVEISNDKTNWLSLSGSPIDTSASPSGSSMIVESSTPYRYVRFRTNEVGAGFYTIIITY